MSQYLLAVYATDSVYDTPIEEAQPMYDATDAFNKRIMAEGSWVFAGGLDRLEMATVVDGTGSEVVVTDGPYVETKEYLGGFWIVEAPDLDAALKIAAEGSKACGGRVEVRPINTAE